MTDYWITHACLCGSEFHSFTCGTAPPHILTPTFTLSLTLIGKDFNISSKQLLDGIFFAFFFPLKLEDHIQSQHIQRYFTIRLHQLQWWHNAVLRVSLATLPQTKWGALWKLPSVESEGLCLSSEARWSRCGCTESFTALSRSRSGKSRSPFSYEQRRSWLSAACEAAPDLWSFCGRGLGVQSFAHGVQVILAPQLSSVVSRVLLVLWMDSE